MKRIVSFVFMVMVLSSAVSQDVVLSKWGFGLFFKGSVSARPKVHIDKGMNVMNPSFSFGYEYGFNVQFDINKRLSTRFGFGKGTIDFTYYYNEEFIIEYANSYFFPLKQDDIDNLPKKERPLTSPYQFDYQDLSFSLFYYVPLRRSNYHLAFYGGINLLSITPVVVLDNYIYLETSNSDTIHSFPFTFEHSTNAYKVPYQKYDFGLNFGVEFSRVLKNYNHLSISIGVTYISRYIISGNYYGNSSTGEYQGSYIQSPTMLELKLNYLLNFGAITHYSRK